MNARALHAEDPGQQAEPDAVWPRLGEIAAPAFDAIADVVDHLPA